MVNRLLQNITYGHRFCGIEYTSKNGQDSFNVSVLKQTKKELVEDIFAQENSIGSLASKLSKHQHIFLIINTDKVLTKTFDSDQKDALKLVYKAYPNIDIDNFYFEVLSQANKHFVALCRRDYVDYIIKEFSEHQLAIIDFSLGHSLVGLLPDFTDEHIIYSSNAKIELFEKKIKHIEKEEPPLNRYNINGLMVSNTNLLSFAGAIQSVLKNNFTTSNFLDKKEELQDDFKQSRFFNQFLKFGGIFILGLLLVNFFFFNHYFNNVKELEQISELNQSTKTKIVTLDSIVSKKKKMIDDILKSNASKSSFYSDRIIATMPNSILLSELEFQPLVKRIKKEKPIELDTNTIIISGTSNDSKVFSEWVSMLEKLHWVKNIGVVDYGSKSKSISEFQIKITLHND